MYHREKLNFISNISMAKSIKCSDIRVDCNWCAAAATEGELMVMIENHAKTHGYFEIPEEMLLKVKSAIRDEVIDTQATAIN